jgi:hypothetical protein
VRAARRALAGCGSEWDDAEPCRAVTATFEAEKTALEKSQMQFALEKNAEVTNIRCAVQHLRERALIHPPGWVAGNLRKRSGLSSPSLRRRYSFARAKRAVGQAVMSDLSASVARPCMCVARALDRTGPPRSTQRSRSV